MPLSLIHIGMEKVYTIDDLMQAIKESGRSYDTDRIMAAYQVAKEAHKDQRRRSGEPYISHPIAVAIILVGLGMDTETLVAALLHDVVEDTATTGESIEKQFGEDVALMVNGVTKLCLLYTSLYLLHVSGRFCGALLFGRRRRSHQRYE